MGTEFYTPPSITRVFKCPDCGSVETVVSHLHPGGFYMMGSAVDNCTACDSFRNYSDEETCLDELYAPGMRDYPVGARINEVTTVGQLMCFRVLGDTVCFKPRGHDDGEHEVEVN